MQAGVTHAYPSNMDISQHGAAKEALPEPEVRAGQRDNSTHGIYIKPESRT